MGILGSFFALVFAAVIIQFVFKTLKLNKLFSVLFNEDVLLYKIFPLVSISFSILSCYMTYTDTKSICNGCIPPKEICVKFKDYVNGGIFEIGEDFIIRTESEFSLLPSPKQPKIEVKYIRSNQNIFANEFSYYVVGRHWTCNPFKEFLGECNFNYLYCIDIICTEPYIHIKIKDDDLSFFRDFYHFPNCQ